MYSPCRSSKGTIKANVLYCIMHCVFGWFAYVRSTPTDAESRAKIRTKYWSCVYVYGENDHRHNTDSTMYWVLPFTVLDNFHPTFTVGKSQKNNDNITLHCTHIFGRLNSSCQYNISSMYFTYSFKLFAIFYIYKYILLFIF